MKNRNRKIPFFLTCFLAMSILPFSLSGCLPQRQEIGYGIDPKNRIGLKTGSHEGVFKTDDLNLTFRYRYAKDSAGLRIDGDLRYAGKLSHSYSALKTFLFWIYFVDSSNRVLDRKILVQAGELDGFEKKTVRKEFSLPPETDAVAFGYTGQTLGDALIGEGIDFWFTPF